MKGLIHLYEGYGKGKTTAAVGLSVRAAGAGMKVLFVQFSKDGTSSEIKSFEALENIETAFVATNFGFYKYMKDETKEEAENAYTDLFRAAIQKAAEEKDMLVLDEVTSAIRNRLIPKDEVIRFLKEKPEELEVVLTGRDPIPELVELADYVTEMKKVKHPYDQGILARIGIEY